MQNPHPSGSIARQVVRGQAEYLERATLAENPASQGPLWVSRQSRRRPDVNGTTQCSSKFENRQCR